MSSIVKIFKKKDKNEEIIDSVKDALDDIRAMPTIHQIIIGGSGGLVSGYIVKRVGRVAAITLGGTLILLQAAQHFGYVNINWKKVQNDLKKKANKAVKALEQTSGVTDQESFDRFISNTKLFVKDNLTFGLSFLGGIFIVASKKPKKAKVCANPVFESWLEELRNDAVARDLQSKHTYTKCLNSLRKYPLPLNNGKECNILEGFGDKICQIIDKKLEKFLKEGGKLHEEDEYDHRVAESDQYDTPKVKRTVEININQAEREKKSIFKRKVKDKPKEKENINEDEDKSEEATAPKARKIREYLPEFRSGAYAILITLFENKINDDDDDFINFALSKADLMKFAQKHCDSSFSVSEGNNHYTAWSSMSTLIKKQLVIKSTTKVPLFYLSKEGEELAKKLRNTKNDETFNDSQKQKLPEPLTKKTFEKRPTFNDENSNFSVKNSQESTIKRFDQIVLSDNDDDIIENVVIKPKIYDIPLKERLKMTNQTSNGYQEIQTIDSDDDIPQVTLEKKATKHLKKYSDDDLEIISDDEPKITTKIAPKTQQTYASSDEDDLPSIDFGIKSSYKNTSPLSKKTMEMKIREDAIFKKPTETLSNQRIQTLNKEESKISNKSQPDIIDTFNSNTYEIIMIVDNCETIHAKRQEIFIKELEKSNIKYEVAKLHIGDFTWVARRKGSQQASDIVLDFIIERKRVDDLCQSIIDGRYKEQKFRLKRSGISNIIYLVEEFGSMRNFSLPEASIKQAIVNTQIIDKFSIKKTSDIKDSVEYLSQITNYIKNLHKNADLKACLKENLENYYGKFPNNKENYDFPHKFLMRFNEFNASSNKNKPPTIKEMFGRALFQVNGLSEEKCLAIIDKYPTPQHLFNAYSNCISDSEREKLLVQLKCGKQMRNLGPALSKTLCLLFYSKGPLN